LSVPTIDGKNPFSFTVAPNPTTDDVVRIHFNMPYATTLEYIVTSLDGKILSNGDISGTKVGDNSMNFTLENASSGLVLVTFIFDNKFFITQKVIKK
jgi:phosphoribulokinase